MDRVKGYFLTALAKMTVTIKDVNIVSVAYRCACCGMALILSLGVNWE